MIGLVDVGTLEVSSANAMVAEASTKNCDPWRHVDTLLLKTDLVPETATV